MSVVRAIVNVVGTINIESSLIGTGTTIAGIVDISEEEEGVSRH